MPSGFSLKTPIFLNWKLTLPLLPRVPWPFVKCVFDVGDGADVVIGGGFDEEGYAVGGISFVEDLFVVGRILALGTLDGRFDAVLWAC
jgi:hypothetical protein